MPQLKRLFCQRNKNNRLGTKETKGRRLVDQVGGIERRVLERLQQSAIGMTDHELRRALQVRLPEITTSLLSLQEKNLVERRSFRWVAKHGVMLQASNIGGRRVSGDRGRTGEQGTVPSTASAIIRNAPLDQYGATGAGKNKNRIDRKESRWATFRNLCEYYAECVRLDQRSTIHAKADEEFKSIVCLDGLLSDDIALTIRTRPAWNEWVRKATGVDYLFLGFPLARYHWKDPGADTEVTFISPVLMVPCRFEVDGTDLRIERVGGIRINEGWLERRLKNLDERKAFLDIIGIQGADESEPEPVERSWADYAQLINHYYHDWCAERLDSTQVYSSPMLDQLTANGIYNRAALIVPRKWKFTSKLHNELLTLANNIPDESLDKSALCRVFARVAPKIMQTAELGVQPKKALDLVGASPLSLNQEQQIAADAGSTADLSVIIGPPGTGKSRVVAAVLANQVLNERSAIFASKNHQALEAVVPRVNALTEPWPLMLRLARPWGAGIDHSMTAAISQLVGSDREADSRVEERLRKSLSKRLNSYRSNCQALESLLECRQLVSEAAFAHEEDLRDIAEQYRHYLVRSVPLPNKTTLESLLRRLASPGKFHPGFIWIRDWLRFRLGWRKAIAQVQSFDATFRRYFDPNSRLTQLADVSSISSVDYFRKCLEFWRPFGVANDSLAQFEEAEKLHSQFADVDTTCRSVNEAAKEVALLSGQLCNEIAAQTGAGISNEERTMLADILATIDNRGSLDSDDDKSRWQKALRKAFPVFLKHYRVIATTNLSIHRDIGLESALFDLLIVDEASQCDIASVIPLLFRARRAMIVGDPMQLSHVTSLSSATDRLLRRQFSVDAIELERFSYRSTSIFHLANTSEQVTKRTSLRQHHRCHPSIAEYCNQNFYRGSWVVLTDSGQRRGLLWTNVAEDSEAEPGGGATSKLQQSQIVVELRRLEAEGYAGSIGVVTPFRKQADRLRDAIHQAFSKRTLDSWQMLVNTADGFQGDERDLVLMSLVAGENLTEGSMRFLAAGPNRFNVAVSRAKQQLHVLGDANWARRCSIGHIRSLIEACDREADQPAKYDSDNFRSDLVGPVWEPALAEALKSAGLSFYQQFPTHGRFLDFALFNGELKLNVEVDGEAYHRSASGGNVEADMRRDQALVAAGWKILRFWVYQLRHDINGCVSKIRQVYEASGPNC